MNKFISQIILLSLFLTLPSYSKELWQSFKFETTIIDNKVKQVNEFSDSSFLILIDGKNLYTYEEHIDCYFNNNFSIDSINNDSIYSSGFLSTDSSSSTIDIKRLYYSDNNLINLYSVKYLNEELQEIAKIFFTKIDTLLLNQLVKDICETNIIVDRKVLPEYKSYKKKDVVFNLLGKKMDKSILKKTNKLNKYIYR